MTRNPGAHPAVIEINSFNWEIGRNYMSIIIIIISSSSSSSNSTVLLFHSVICFGYFMPMRHGVDKKAPSFVSPPPLP